MDGFWDFVVGTGVQEGIQQNLKTTIKLLKQHGDSIDDIYTSLRSCEEYKDISKDTIRKYY